MTIRESSFRETSFRENDNPGKLLSGKRPYTLKISKMPEFYTILARKNYQNARIFMIFAWKIYKIPEFYMIFARKMSEFYIIIARKIFFPEF